MSKNNKKNKENPLFNLDSETKNNRKTQKTTVHVLANILSIDNCHFIEYDENSIPKFAEVGFNYSNKQTPISNNLNEDYDFNCLTDLLINLYKEKKENKLYIKDIEEYIKNNNISSDKIKKFFKDLNFKSGLFLSVFEDDKPKSIFITNFTEKTMAPGAEKKLIEYDENFIKILIDYVDLIITKNEMESIIKKMSKSSDLLKEIRHLVEKSLDINVIKSGIIKELVKVFNPDRCFFRVYDNNRKILYSVENEYLVSRDVESITYYIYPREANEYSILNYSEKGTYIVEDVDSFINEHNYSQISHLKQTIRVFKEQNLKSFYGFAIYYEDKLAGILELQYTKEKVILTKENIHTLKNIATQASIALKEAEFFEFQKYTAKKERILREITEQLFLINEENELFDYILKKIVEIFNIDGAMFIEIPQEKGSSPTIKYEYQTDTRFPSLLHAELPVECLKTYGHMISTFFPVVVNNTHNFYADEQGRQCFYNQYLVEAFMTTPIITETYPHLAIGGMVLFTHSPRIWLKNEIDFMRGIDDVIMSAINRIKRLRELDELRNSFIQTMTHDLQIPLVGENKALEYLLKKSDNETIGSIKPILNELKLNNEYSHEALIKYIEIYKYESGSRTLNLKNINISTVADKAIKNIEHLITSKNIDFKINIQNNLPLLKMEAQEISKVIYNFIDNAISYSEENSKIELNIKENKDKIYVCVNNNGPAIPKELQSMIFNRFKMIERTERKVGSGLSLYLSKLIIEAHGGSIWYETNQKNGSMFCFTLPKE
ncbi:MAG: ATP-binding protein [bacterium]